MGFEFQILDKLQTIHTPLLDRFMVAITKLGDAGIVWIILTVILLLIPKTRKSGVYMAVALIADLIICNVILKPIVARIRPYSINQTVQLLVTPLKDYSFPSGHTAASFASVSALYFAGRKRMAAGALIVSVLIALGHTAASFAAVAALYFAGAKKWWKITLPLAILMAFSRMYLYVHYPTDVLGGLIIGLLCGWIADMIIQKVMEKRSRKSR